MKRSVALPLLILALLTSALLGLPGCGRGVDPWAGEDQNKTRVVVSIAPLASFVKAVGGDRVAVRCLCTRTGPHHYSPDTQDGRVLDRAHLMFTVGLRLDDAFAESMRVRAHRADLPLIKLGLEVKDRLEMKHECCDHDHGDGHGHEHQHGKYDPHVWLGAEQAAEMVAVIRDELMRVDPDNKGEYEANAKAYTARLNALHQEGKKLLAGKKVKRLISFHESLGYLANSYGLEIADVIELGAGDEPSAAHLTRIVERCKDKAKPIGAIAVEPQYPAQSARTIQGELKGKGFDVPLVEIDPLETADPADLDKEGGDWYLKRMRENLRALAKALP